MHPEFSELRPGVHPFASSVPRSVTPYHARGATHRRMGAESCHEPSYAAPISVILLFHRHRGSRVTLDGVCVHVVHQALCRELLALAPFAKMPAAEDVHGCASLIRDMK